MTQGNCLLLADKIDPVCNFFFWTLELDLISNFDLESEPAMLQVCQLLERLDTADPGDLRSVESEIDAYLAEKQRKADERALQKELREGAGCRQGVERGVARLI